MSSRRYVGDQFTQCHNPVDYTVIFNFNGTGTPSLGEGDVTQSYMTAARTSVGIYTVTTKDPFVAITNFSVQIAQTGVPGALINAQPQVPTKNANNTYTFTFYVYNNNTLADMAAGNIAAIYLRFRNSTTLP